MSTNTINCDGSSCGGFADARRRPTRESGVVRAGARHALRLLAAVLMAASLAACAQSPGATDRSASLSASRLTSTEPTRSAERSRKTNTSFVASRANVTNRQAAETQEATSGLASFYGQGHVGSKTANGEKFNSRELTAAHRSLPFGTRVRVTNVATGKSVTVRVNDRGPFVPGRVIDVSQAAAEELGMVSRGVTKVKLDVVR